MMFIMQLDYSLFQDVNDFAGRFPLLDEIMKFFAQDGEYLFFIGVIIYWFTRTRENRKMVAAALCSACLALGVGGVLSSLFYRNRPFVAHHVIQLIGHPANASFPSDHATGAFVIAVSIWLARRRDGRFWLAAAALISFSRVWTGVHYPFDILAGAVIGTASALVVHKLFKSGLLEQRVSMAIGLYERIEHKLWPVRHHG